MHGFTGGVVPEIRDEALPHLSCAEDDLGLRTQFLEGDFAPPGVCPTRKVYVELGRRDRQQSRSKTRVSSEENYKSDDIYVRKCWVIYSTFARRSFAGSIDTFMEERFARAKYRQFRGAFGQTSLIMAMGSIGLALIALRDTEAMWGRIVILMGVVAPMYLVYCFFTIRFVDKYESMYGTCLETQLIFCLCLQTLAIVFAEWARPRLDYGMLVMHIGFVHNFTPLSAGAMQVISAGFGLVPYGFLKWLLSFDDSFRLVPSSKPGTKISLTGADTCIITSGDESLVLEILVPVVSLLYQIIVTMRRDESMRLDFLSSEQLRAQRNLLAIEKKKCEDLLSSMLPNKIITQLKANEPIEPQLFPDVTVIFVEICHFSQLCTRLTPKAVVEVLNIIYLEFDRLSDKLHVYKVETVGQVYMAVVGCPESIVNHADVAAHFALTAQQAMHGLRAQIADINSVQTQASHPNFLNHDVVCPGRGALERLDRKVTTPTFTIDEVVIRVGLNSGRLRAGVVGLDSPRYKLVGDTVNTASRMESTCEPGRIQVSKSTQERLTDGMFLLQDRGEIVVKGKGNMRTAFLNGWSDKPEFQQRSVMIEFAVDTDTHALAFGPNTSLSPTILDVFDQEARGAFPANSCQDEDDPPNRCTDWSFVNAAFHHDDQDDFEKPRYASEHRSAAVLCQRFALLFLLVPPDQKEPSWIATLKKDESQFEQETVQKRVSEARNLTIVWQLLLALVASIDYFMNVLEEDLPRYRRALLFRAFGNNVVGLVYLLLLTSRHVFEKHGQHTTLIMLLVQGCSILACGMIIYNSEVAVVSMYGSYVLFYRVCTFNQRLVLCAMTVVGYVLAELSRCGWTGVVDAGFNISFLFIFFVSMACGVRLDEHLAHVAHFDQRRALRSVQAIRQAKIAGSQLLISLLPPHVVKLVGEGISPIAEHHSDVSIIFTDIKGFTAYSSKISPHELVDFLNSMYSAFDEIIVNWQLHKVEIIGDAYFVSAGCPPKASASKIDSKEYAMRAVEVALALQRTLPTVCDDGSVQMRVGIHTGSVVAGVVGKKGPRYHLFGPTVGYAEQMESNGIPGRVQVSDTTHRLLCEAAYDYVFEQRTIEIEGYEEPQRTWLVQKGTSKQAFQIQKKLLSARRRLDEKTMTITARAIPTTNSVPGQNSHGTDMS
eukprot:TRINITY_DN56054_c0_g1_i1.p1 TRINITY_DN56054_c0_g1~~TRINITY_DN56054_c0_g1_i1.p1  ORF type:complete len:1165 (+),score=200.27 TRINITY_DN56054_c0_g1_i1:92-3586(+)